MTKWLVYCDEYGDGWCVCEYVEGMDVRRPIERHMEAIGAQFAGWNVLECDYFPRVACAEAFYVSDPDHLEKLPFPVKPPDENQLSLMLK